MKSNLLRPSLHPLVVLAVVGTLSVAFAAAQSMAPRAELSIQRGDPAAAGRISVADAGNHAWVLEASTNLATWFELEAWKVHNGTYHQTIGREDSRSQLFFRVMSDPDRPGLESTVENALRLPAAPFNYAAPSLPPPFLAPAVMAQDNTPTNNPVTDAGATLGRVLFYDQRLSANQTVSCSSCHQREHGFSDARRFSVGFNGGLTGRNSMGLSNARWYQRRHFFWDERAATLEEQVLQPIQNAVEMGMTLPALEARLGAEPFYATLFTRAFGTSTVTAERIALALAQFVRSILSTQSKFDQGQATGFANFTPEENLGRQIFFGQVGNATCVACHGTINFVPVNNLNNNGLENPYVDKGVGAITGLARDEGLFKVPSLRNIALTAPYMHDGRFATLEEVVEFYNSGVVNHPNLSPPLRTPPRPGVPPAPLRLNLTVAQKAALVSFLKTLTDPSVAAAAKYSDPFNYGN